MVGLLITLGVRMNRKDIEVLTFWVELCPFAPLRLPLRLIVLLGEVVVLVLQVRRGLRGQVSRQEP